MKTIVFKLLLVAAPLFICSCSKENDTEPIDQPEVVENSFAIDSTKNAFYVDTNEFSLVNGIVEYYGRDNESDGYLFTIYLWTEGLSYDGETASGFGDFINIDIFSESKASLQQGNYYCNNYSLECGVFKSAISLNFDVNTGAREKVLLIKSGNLSVTLDDNYYELTINALADLINEDTDAIISSHEIFLHYKGNLPEYNFYTDPVLHCTFDTDTMDFTFGIDYTNPDIYLIPGEQSQLSDNNINKVTDAIGTPSNDLNGVLKVCHWVNQNFTFENAGGNMIGKVTVDELFEEMKYYGCHSQALLISSIVRAFGIPALLIETADIQWAYDYYNGDVEYFAGHVMSELFVDGKWILFDNNCTYVENYDHENPFISLRRNPESGLFVYAKGVDTWAYSNKNENFTHEQMIYFSDNVYCYEDLFFTLKYEWHQ